MKVRYDQAWRNRRFMAVALVWIFFCVEPAYFVPAAIAQENEGQDSIRGNPDGQSLFIQCSACHALESGRNGRGPTLYHLFGRKSGTVPGYDYSLAMKKAGIIWRDDTLARFIRDPQHVVPGTKMTFASRTDQQQAKALIEYLRIATR